jgi:hypothetical protein
MKKTLYLIISISLLLGSIYLLSPIIHKNNLPSTSYKNLKNKHVDLSKLYMKKKETFVFYIDPTCNSCNHISSILDTLKNEKYNRILISSFIKGIDYNKYKNNFNLLKEDIFLIDYKNNFISDFNIGITYNLPLVLKYDEKGRLLMKY